MARKRSARKKFKRFVSSVVALLIFVSAWYVYHNYIADDQSNIEVPIPDGAVRVTFLDVGQGDATLIETSTGERMLIDAGKELRSQYTDADDRISEMGITTLDYFVITHYDYDHIGSASKILELCEVKNVLTYDYEPESATGKTLVSNIEKENANVIYPEKGYSFTMGSVHFEVISSCITEENRYSDENENSLCILMTYGETKFLFTGDAETKREAELVSDYKSKLDVDVFQAGHHGSETSNSTALLAYATPDYAIFSCGEGNSYGHPTAGAMDRIDDHAKTIFRTDLNGTVTLITDGTTITYEVEKGSVITTWIGWETIYKRRLAYAA